MVLNNISWGEITILISAGIIITGKKDLPIVSKYVGTQIGRIVGMLQGIRTKTDQFTQHNELKQLHNQLRSGLRELDQVKTELAIVSSPTTNFIGKQVQPMISSVNRNTNINTNSTSLSGIASSSSSSTTTTKTQRVTPSFTNNTNMTTTTSSSNPTQIMQQQQQQQQQQHILSPTIQTEHATMEEEWEKQGIGFKSKAEQGIGIGKNITLHDDNNNNNNNNPTTGSELLERMIKETLIFDQYDRVVGQKELEMQQRIQNIINNKKKNSDDKDNKDK